MEIIWGPSLDLVLVELARYREAHHPGRILGQGSLSCKGRYAMRSLSEFIDNPEPRLHRPWFTLMSWAASAEEIDNKYGPERRKTPREFLIAALVRLSKKLHWLLDPVDPPEAQ